MMAARSKRKPSPAFGSRTDIGCVREQNEDSLVVAPPLYVVCDGMGGHAAGEIASEIAVEVISERAPSKPDAEALGQAVQEANLAIMTAAEGDRGHEGMGTTCTAAMLENERLVIAQVGDSRAYLLNQGNLQQITRDHSLVADLVEAGQITTEEARAHPQRSIITRALGSDPTLEPDIFEINVEAGDRLLLCSDGLTSMVNDSEIESVLRETSDPQLAAIQLVNAAIAAGGHDNITVIVVNITWSSDVARRRVSRRTRITATLIIVLLCAAIAGAGYAFNYVTTHFAYLGEQDGKVVIYQGVPGSIGSISFSHAVEVTDVKVDDLQPSAQDRVKDEEIRTNSLQEAKDLVESYREDIAENEAKQKEQKEKSADEDEKAGGEENPDNPEQQDAPGEPGNAPAEGDEVGT